VGELTALCQTPWLYFMGATSKGRAGEEGEERKGKWKRRGEKGEGREVRGAGPSNILA